MGKFKIAMYGLNYEIGWSLSHISPTGAKNMYFSKYNNATSIGYKPMYSALDTIKEESIHIIQANNKL